MDSTNLEQRVEEHIYQAILRTLDTYYFSSTTTTSGSPNGDTVNSTCCNDTWALPSPPVVVFDNDSVQKHHVDTTTTTPTAKVKSLNMLIPVWKKECLEYLNLFLQLQQQERRDAAGGLSSVMSISSEQRSLEETALFYPKKQKWIDEIMNRAIGEWKKKHFESSEAGEAGIVEEEEEEESQVKKSKIIGMDSAAAPAAPKSSSFSLFSSSSSSSNTGNCNSLFFSGATGGFLLSSMITWEMIVEQKESPEGRLVLLLRVVYLEDLLSDWNAVQEYLLQQLLVFSNNNNNNKKDDPKGSSSNNNSDTTMDQDRLALSTKYLELHQKWFTKITSSSNSSRSELAVMELGLIRNIVAAIDQYRYHPYDDGVSKDNDCKKKELEYLALLLETFCPAWNQFLTNNNSYAMTYRDYMMANVGIVMLNWVVLTAADNDDHAAPDSTTTSPTCSTTCNRILEFWARQDPCATTLTLWISCYLAPFQVLNLLMSCTDSKKLDPHDQQQKEAVKNRNSFLLRLIRSCQHCQARIAVSDNKNHDSKNNENNKTDIVDLELFLLRLLQSILQSTRVAAFPWHLLYSPASSEQSDAILLVFDIFLQPLLRTTAASINKEQPNKEQNKSRFCIDATDILFRGISCLDDNNSKLESTTSNVLLDQVPDNNNINNGARESTSNNNLRALFLERLAPVVDRAGTHHPNSSKNLAGFQGLAT